MSNRIEPIAETWLCIDCMIWHENNEGEPVTIDMDISANWGGDENGDDPEDGHDEFSSVPCGACDTRLAGSRYRYAVWAW